MSWINQTTGNINHHQETDFGTQPIRVLHWMNLFMFTRTHDSFFDELKEEIKTGKLNGEIDIVYAEEPIRKANGQFNTPRANGVTRKIELHETFLSYLWCCTYSVFIRYVETIDFPNCNRLSGYEKYPISEENIAKANEVFDYARNLIVDFVEWDKTELPNPEIYEAEKRDYVEQTNCYYTEAVKFILIHEFTHLKLHIDEINKETPDSQYLKYEIEADNNAINKIKSGLPTAPSPLADAHRLASENGIILGLLSMFFFKATTEGVRHPNSEDRLTNALESLDLINNDFAWGIACIGLKMWDEQFGLTFDWIENPASYQALYYNIIEQIKNR